jgi:predicted MFS family arabinose efflux permease
MTEQYLKDFSVGRRPSRMQHLFRSSMPRNLEVLTQARARDEGSTITGQLVALFAAAVGIIILNVFAPQILVGLIAPELGLGTATAGLVAMMTVLGYAAGLIFLVPLADRVESRRLVLYLLLIAVAAAAAVPLMPNALDFLADLFVLGAASSVAQVLVPLAASMARPEIRGRVVGDVMSGLIVGILLSRPLASGLADRFGWRAFFGVTALAIAGLALMLAWRLPRHQPDTKPAYGSLLASLWHLLRKESVLRRRALTAGLCMAAFSVFWTAIALRLVEAPFQLGQRGIAIFALVGAGGAVTAALAGRAGDRGWTRATTLSAHLLIVAALALAAWAGSWGSMPRAPALALLGASAVLLDVGATTDQTLGRRAVNLLRPEARSRLNGLFVGLFFIGGAIGSAATGLAWSIGGWLAVCGLGASFAALALLVDWSSWT